MMPDPTLVRPGVILGVGYRKSRPLALTENWSDMTEKEGPSL